MANSQVNRRNTFIIDFSSLPRQVKDAETVSFLETRLQITHEHVISLQVKRNYVFVEVPSLDIAQGYVDRHDKKHVIKIDDHDYAVRLVMEDGGVNVKVRDLPPQWNTDMIVDQLKQYGKVISAKDDTWDIGILKGIRNGTRTIRMIIYKPIPSYMRMYNELAFISYPNQQHTCKSCNKPIHPNKRCSEVTQQRFNLVQRLAMSNESQGESESVNAYQDDEIDCEVLEHQPPSYQLPTMRPSTYADAVISGRSGNMLNKAYPDATRKRGPENADFCNQGIPVEYSNDHRTLLNVVRNLNQPAEKSARQEGILTDDEM